MDRIDGEGPHRVPAVDRIATFSTRAGAGGRLVDGIMTFSTDSAALRLEVWKEQSIYLH